MAESQRDNTTKENYLKSNNNNNIPKEEHPLKTPWVFWYDKANRGATATEYMDQLTRVKTFSTVEDFWRAYEGLPKVCDLMPGVTYHLMREGRKPMWEDELNYNGGTWKFRVPKKDSSRLWFELLLAAVGEQFNNIMPHPDKIVGLSVSVRGRDDIVQLWNDDSSMAPQATDSLRTFVDGLIADAPINFESFFYKRNQRDSQTKEIPLQHSGLNEFVNKRF